MAGLQEDAWRQIQFQLHFRFRAAPFAAIRDVCVRSPAQVLARHESNGGEAENQCLLLQRLQGQR